MKISELREKIQEFNDNMEIVISDADEGSLLELTEIQVQHGIGYSWWIIQ